MSTLKKQSRFYVLSILITLFVAENGYAQLKKITFPDSLFSTYYHQRITHFRTLPKTKNDIVFLGNSITDGAEWSELFADNRIKNRGISGDISAGVLNRIDEIATRKPAKVFLMIGINDLSRNTAADSIFKNIIRVASYLKQESPSTKLYVQSVLPVNDVYKKFGGHTSKGEQIKLLNANLKQNAAAYQYTYIDLHTSFCDATGKLLQQYTNDGLHLKGEGYLLWKHLIYPHVFNLESKPSLLPKPQQLKWNTGSFSLTSPTKILVEDPILFKEGLVLKNAMEQRGLSVALTDKISSTEHSIQLRLGNISTPQGQSEAYHLETTNDKVVLTANTPQGIYNGIQTLVQLMRDNVAVDASEITDWPAFAWRGFMVDVGRNYQSIQQLKQQIDVMAAYKLNIFHFHLTEDIAWRLQSKLYPQLTSSKTMLRNPGEFYSLEEMKDLIAYCKERYITLIPEIDMPGHSAAFKRAMGVDMQSNEGVAICKNILIELSKELSVPYIHIGGDEVHITNKEFLPTMVAELKLLGKKIIAWDPGGNVPEGTIKQMWIGTATPKDKFPALDSRHLYLNAFDPIDGVVATFNHQICDVAAGDETKLGAILCNWPDRRVSKEEDLIKMNAVYSVMLAFAERSWLGGGWKNFLSDISTPGTERYTLFVDFENRLLDHKTLYFKNLSFPYVKQSDIEWKLIGPFDNKGATEKIFKPESKSYLEKEPLHKNPVVYGGTIWFRHFWFPMIQAHVKDQKENTTWYATTKIWSDEKTKKNFWIGFNNLSRSTFSDSPPAAAWDNKNSALWVNNVRINPPHWAHAGQKGDSEIPLFDEGYEYRSPTKIVLEKGWNTILVKCPVGKFSSNDAQNPVKWMFTFVEVKE
ncbi:family 20 glycosylhydrolase [Flavobacterium sp. ZS1P14]|uniref:family 20 glycosylhydrolase n=1 Tax=Flavobacterium sp. ZS1P14 TaxID=3401729 RepID=UPI003AB033B8